jgi:BatD DUF11 like domain
MKNGTRNIIFSLAVFLLSCFYIRAQVTFHTIVTQSPVVVGESFQVQYVIEDLDKEDDFFVPDFKEFRFVSGPNMYTGSALGKDGPKKMKNIVYTLAAVKPGKFIIPGASARVGDKLIKSENVHLQVISKTDLLKKSRSAGQESNEDYFLGPEEDPYNKIRRNLFIKVSVDKRTCFVGEPVTATFKLYSRLESRSDIVKNPGFYGFTVQDIVNLSDRISTTENISGKKFDVHVVRKVQLYPLQAGIFNIDAMEVRNKVEFSKSVVFKKTEQEIAEGVFTDNDGVEKANTVVFETNMNTETVPINVKPAPVKTKPAGFSGATGVFNIDAILEKSELAKNEESNLIITINGKGNFTQLEAPVIQWPAGIEGFDPAIKDSLDTEHSPLRGKREFRFRFVSAKPGNYVLPSVKFSFFKPDSNIYKTISTPTLRVNISYNENIAKEVVETQTRSKMMSDKWKWLLGIAGSVLLAVVLVYRLRKNKNTLKSEPVPEKNSPAVADILQPAYTFLEADDRMFYSILRNCIWDFFSRHFGLTGSKMSKSSLSAAMEERKIEDESKKNIIEILNQCEIGIFADAKDAINKTQLLEKTKAMLTFISTKLN